MTTEAKNRGVARQHTAGWTESFWSTSSFNFVIARWNAREAARQLLLPAQATIVGYRAQTFNMDGNKLLPGGTTNGRQQKPGLISNICDLPQVALQLNLRSNSSSNTGRMELRGIPDDQIKFGEYDPTPAFVIAMNAFIATCQKIPMGFVGRDLSLGPVRMVSVTPIAGTSNATLVTDAAIPGVAVGDYVRFSRVYDSRGRPVSGSWKVLTAAAPTYTLESLKGITVDERIGTVRKDALAYFDNGSIVVHRAVVRKVGRPSESYRGRR